MNAGPALPSAAGFWQAVGHRLRPRPRTAALYLLVLAMLVLFAGYALVMPAWQAPLATRLTRLFYTAFTAVVMFLAVAVADEAVDRGLPQLPTYASAVIVAALIGALLGWHVREAVGLRYDFGGHTSMRSFPIARRVDMFLICALVGGLATFVHVSRRTAMVARRRQQEAERARASAERRTLESQLQALQARVEPMFLFGTLERIRQLYRTDAATAGSMLEDLIVYLRAALPHLRESSSVVTQELTLAHAWLDIVGRAAHWQIEFDVADAARGAPLPALVLLPLVQHAVAGAGSAPLQLRLVVRAEQHQLCFDLLTSTAAFAAGVAGQPLLEQIGTRLAALHGAAADFECGPAADPPNGSQARILLPLVPGAETRDEGAAP